MVASKGEVYGARKEEAHVVGRDSVAILSLTASVKASFGRSEGISSRVGS